MSGIIELKMVQARLDMFADELLKLLTWSRRSPISVGIWGLRWGAEKAFGKAFCERRKVTSRCRLRLM